MIVQIKNEYIKVCHDNNVQTFRWIEETLSWTKSLRMDYMCNPNGDYGIDVKSVDYINSLVSLENMFNHALQTNVNNIKHQLCRIMNVPNGMTLTPETITSIKIEDHKTYHFRNYELTDNNCGEPTLVPMGNGGVTVVAIKVGRKWYYGFSVCNIEDSYNKTYGRALAFYRALAMYQSVNGGNYVDEDRYDYDLNILSIHGGSLFSKKVLKNLFPSVEEMYNVSIDVGVYHKGVKIS